MKIPRFLVLFLIITIFISGDVYSDDAGQMYQKGIFAEHGKGNLREAIEFYEEAFQEEYEDDKLSAKILLRLGICYEKLGKDEEAKEAYQQIVWRFPSQEEISNEATERLRNLSAGLVSDGYWFRYKGQPIYLIGCGTTSIYAGSGLSPEMPVTDDPVGDWQNYIDLLVQYRINFVRFHPWDFLHHTDIADYASPWMIDTEKKSYDLNSFNPKYWEYLKQIISYASARDILFEIVLFDDDSPWDKNPFNQKFGGALNDKSEYHDLGNVKNREYQEKYVAKTIAETMKFPVVIYEICNAVGWEQQPLSRTMRNWVLHWVNFIEERLPPASSHSITVSQYSKNLNKESDTLWDLPGIDIISIHETEGTKSALAKEDTHGRFLDYWKADFRKPMMINSVSFGDMKSHPKGGTRGWAEERQHLWMAFASGGHAARSDFQPFVATHPSMDFCQNLAKFIQEIKFWEMTPTANFVLSCDGKFYSIGSNSEFVAYIRTRSQSKGEKIKLKLPDGKYEMRWYDPISGNFLPNSRQTNGGEVSLNMPETTTDIVLYASRL